MIPWKPLDRVKVPGGGSELVLYRRGDEFAIRVEPSEAVAKSGVLHRLIRGRAATGHVLVHYTRPGETALDGYGAVAMRLHQALEEPVAEDENVLPSVERFSEAKQFHRVAQGGDHLVDGGIEGLGRMDRERNRLACNPIIERCVQLWRSFHVR